MSVFDKGTWVSVDGSHWHVAGSTAWYVAPLRWLGSFGQFVLDAKLGADLGYPWPEAIRFAWSIWGWQTARA